MYLERVLVQLRKSFRAPMSVNGDNEDYLKLCGLQHPVVVPTPIISKSSRKLDSRMRCLTTILSDQETV